MEAFNIQQAANALGVNRSTLWRWMKEGDAPPHFRQGRRVLFPRVRLLEWMDSKTKH